MFFFLSFIIFITTDSVTRSVNNRVQKSEKLLIKVESPTKSVFIDWQHKEQKH